jgi:hypothetical protein
MSSWSGNVRLYIDIDLDIVEGIIAFTHTASESNKRETITSLLCSWPPDDGTEFATNITAGKGPQFEQIIFVHIVIVQILFV